MRKPCLYRHRLDPMAPPPRVKDGDSLQGVLLVDVDRPALKQNLRVLDVDAPEVKEVLGEAATNFTRWWVQEHVALEWWTWRYDDFGRRLGYLVDLQTGEDLSAALLETGNAVRAHLEHLVVGRRDD